MTYLRYFHLSQNYCACICKRLSGFIHDTRKHSVFWLLFVFSSNVCLASTPVVQGNLVASGHTGYVSWILPNVNGLPQNIDRIYFGIRTGTGWLPVGAQVNMSCIMNILAEGWDSPRTYLLSTSGLSGNDVKSIYIPKIDRALETSGYCNSVFSNTTHESIVMDNTMAVFVNYNTTLIYNTTVSGTLGPLVSCSVSAPAVVNFIGLPESYVNGGMTESVDISINCAGAGAGVRFSSTGIPEGDCSMVGNSSSENGQLRFCVRHNGQLVKLDYSSSVILPLDNGGNASTTFQVTMDADSIDMVFSGLYSTVLYIIVSPS